MYCPNCGVENAQGQKYCRRCGVNLLTADYARKFINETTTGQPYQTAAPSVLKITALVSILGFLFITIGAFAMTVVQYDSPEGRHGPPLGLFLAMFGYAALVLICRQLVKLAMLPAHFIKAETRLRPLQAVAPAYQAPALHGHTNRNLAEAPSYHSVTESETQQFDSARHAGQ